jgi:hypothetical protein
MKWANYELLLLHFSALLCDCVCVVRPGTLALIDRNFQGFGKELFTDAGKYVIHFGMPPDTAAEQATVSRQVLDA